MSSISVLQAPGVGQVTTAKTDQSTSPQTLQNQPSSSAAVSTSAPIYPSPRIEIDPQLNTVIIQYVNSANGLANYQVPSKSQLQAYQQQQNAHDTKSVGAVNDRVGNIDGNG